LAPAVFGHKSTLKSEKTIALKEFVDYLEVKKKKFWNKHMQNFEFLFR